MRAADFGQIDLSAPILVEQHDRRSGSAVIATICKPIVGGQSWPRDPLSSELN